MDISRIVGIESSFTTKKSRTTEGGYQSSSQGVMDITTILNPVCCELNEDLPPPKEIYTPVTPPTTPQGNPHELSTFYLNSPSSSSSSSASSVSSAYFHNARRSNQQYSDEQVDWIRYQKEDCKKSWDDMLEIFRFRWGHRTSRQCLSSRYYRDNTFPLVDEMGQYWLDGENNIKSITVKVRERKLPKFRDANLAYMLVDKSPERALLYDWVSQEHKEIARARMKGIGLKQRVYVVRR